MPAPPRWLLAVPDAIRQLTLMPMFGAELVGAARVLRRTDTARAAYPAHAPGGRASPGSGSPCRSMPGVTVPPRWLLAVPDAIRQLEASLGPGPAHAAGRRAAVRGVAGAGGAADADVRGGARRGGARPPAERAPAPAAAEVPGAGRLPRRGAAARAPGVRAADGAAATRFGRRASRRICRTGGRSSTRNGSPGTRRRRRRSSTTGRRTRSRSTRSNAS